MFTACYRATNFCPVNWRDVQTLWNKPSAFSFPSRLSALIRLSLTSLPMKSTREEVGYCLVSFFKYLVLWNLVLGLSSSNSMAPH